MLKVRYPMKSLLFENFSHDKAVWFFIVTMFNLHRLVHGWWWSQWCKPGACCKSHIRRSMWGLGGFRCTSSGSWSHPRWRYQRSNAFIKYQEMAKLREIFHIVMCPHMIFHFFIIQEKSLAHRLTCCGINSKIRSVESFHGKLLWGSLRYLSWTHPVQCTSIYLKVDDLTLSVSCYSFRNTLKKTN